MIISLWGAFFKGLLSCSHIFKYYLDILIFFQHKNMFITIELSKLTEPKVAYHYLPYANGVFDILST